MKVKVYRNLHKKCWSVVGPQGKVILRTPAVTILDADFVVRPAGRKAVLETGRKTVHAFVVGTLHAGEAVRKDALTPITYNPKLHETFIRRDTGKAVYCSSVVVLDEVGKAYALLPTEAKPQKRLTTLDFLLHHRKAILSPKNWSELLGVRIYDPDGWRKDDKSFDDPIDLDDFLERLTWSTIGPGVQL